MVAAIRFTAALLSATAVFVSAADEYFEGDGTSYTLGQVSSGNCNFMSAIPTASTNYVALNQAQWDNIGNCGRCIEVSCIDEQCTVQNKTAVVQVLDRCPECAHGALDLSPTVYKEITGLDPNRLTVRWRFVDCPNPGTVKVCLKGGSNPNWIAVQPTNAVVGVKSVTVNGAATKMLDGAYYYVSTSSGTDLSAVKVAITSINGDNISGTYSLTADKCVDTKKQFGSGSSQSTPETSAPVSTKATPTSTPAAPVATSATPTATTATPSSTTPTQTYSSSSSEESSNEDETQTGQSSQSDNTSQFEQSSQSDESPSTDTTTPVATTATPVATTATPEATTAIPEATTATPEATTAPTDAPTQSGDTSKCRVRGTRRRN